MVQSLYEEIVVRGAVFVSVRLTPEAYAHGLALAPPQDVLVPAMRAKGRPRKVWALAARQDSNPRHSAWEVPTSSALQRSRSEEGGERALLTRSTD
jgi:hypothetical protein